MCPHWTSSKDCAFYMTDRLQVEIDDALRSAIRTRAFILMALGGMASEANSQVAIPCRAFPAHQ